MIWKLFDKRKATLRDRHCSLKTSEFTRLEEQHVRSMTCRESGDLKTCHTREWTTSDRLTTYLPHTLITSDLGNGDHTFQLRFSHFLMEDPSIAVFSEAQSAPIPSGWRRKSSRSILMVQLDRCIGFPRLQSLCAARVVVGSRWHYKVSPKAVQYWSAEAGLLLVNWSEMYDQYSADAVKRRNKKRVKRIVNRYRDLEKNILRIGDGDLLPATAAEVALACRYEGEGFEDSLERAEQKLSVRKIKTRVKQLAKGIAKMFTRRAGKKR